MHPTGNHIEVRLQITRRCSDVAPVASPGIGKERLFALEQLRKDSVLEHKRFALGDVVEDPGLENIDSRVYRIASDLLGLRLFQKAAHPAVLRCFDQSVGCWVRHWCQNNCRRSLTLAMKAN